MNPLYTLILSIFTRKAAKEIKKEFPSEQADMKVEQPFYTPKTETKTETATNPETSSFVPTSKEEKTENTKISSTPSSSSCYEFDYARFSKVYLSADDITSEMISKRIEDDPEAYSDNSEDFIFTPIKYIYKGKLECDKVFFHLSAKNRFITSDGEVMTSYYKLRDIPRDDFSERLFAVTCDPTSHSLSLGEYTFYFDNPFSYNYVMLLMIDSDNHFKNGERISDRIISYPPIYINDEILLKYDIHIDEFAKEGLLLRNASYSVLNDFNFESKSERAEGTFDLRFIKTSHYNWEAIETLSIQDITDITTENLISNPVISIIHVPPYDELNKREWPYLPFIFILDTNVLTLRGNIEEHELYVCRLQDGWGGIKFKVSSDEDYYKLAVWLLLAVSADLMLHNSWSREDREKQIQEYWPTYSERTDRIKVDFQNKWELDFGNTLMWDKDTNAFQQRSLQIWDDVSKPFSYNEKNYACEILYADINGEGSKILSENDEIICEYIKLENTEIVLLNSDIICALSEYQLALLDQLNKATDNFKLFKSDCSEEIQIKNLNGTCMSSNNEDGDLEVSLDKLYIWDSSRHTFVECSMVLKYSVNSDVAFPVKINIMYGDESDGKASRVNAAQNIDIHFIEDIGITILNNNIMILSDAQKEFFQQNLNG